MGTLVLSGNNTTGGTLTLNSPATLDLNNATAFGSGAVVINGGNIDNKLGSALTLAGANTYTWNGNFSFLGSNNLTIGTGASTISQSIALNVAAGNLFLTGNILDGTGGTAIFTKTGNGTLTLTGTGSNVTTNDVSGGTFVLAGGNNRLQSGSNLNLGDGNAGSGVLVLGNVSGASSQTFNSIAVLGNGTANAIEELAAPIWRRTPLPDRRSGHPQQQGRHDHLRPGHPWRRQPHRHRPEQSRPHQDRSRHLVAHR